MSSTPPDDGLDIDNLSFSEFAKALESEQQSSSDNTDIEMESENSWTPAHRHKKGGFQGLLYNNLF